MRAPPRAGSRPGWRVDRRERGVARRIAVSRRWESARSCHGIYPWQARRAGLHPRDHSALQQNGQAMAYEPSVPGYNTASELFIVGHQGLRVVGHWGLHGAQRRFFSRRLNVRSILRGCTDRPKRSRNATTRLGRRQIGLVREPALEVIDDLHAELVSAPRTRLLWEQRRRGRLVRTLRGPDRQSGVKTQSCGRCR